MEKAVLKVKLLSWKLRTALILCPVFFWHGPSGSDGPYIPGLRRGPNFESTSTAELVTQSDDLKAMAATLFKAGRHSTQFLCNSFTCVTCYRTGDGVNGRESILAPVVSINSSYSYPKKWRLSKQFRFCSSTWSVPKAWQWTITICLHIFRYFGGGGGR